MITSSIVTYNTDKTELSRLIRCADSSNIDIIYIIDNSPTDKLRSFIDTLSKKIIYEHSKKNIGYGGGHNIALKKAERQRVEYHVVLNPDIYFENGSIEKLANYMANHNDVGAIMPLIKYPNGENQYLCKLQATPFDLIGRRFLPKKLTSKRNDIYELKHSGYNKLMNVPCLSGCFMFLRVSIFQSVGYFDDRFFMYCEDFDFYKRIHAKYQTIFYPEVSITHDHKKESYKSKRMMLMHIKSAITYFNKWGWFFDKNRKRANRKILKQIKAQDFSIN